MKLYVIRHAQSPGNKLSRIDSISQEFDIGLSEEGKKQAKELIPILNKNKYDVIIVSPLSRTIETLKPFLETINNPKVIVSDLAIEMNFGDLIGKPISSIKEYHKKDNIIDKVSFQPPGGESLLEVYERSKKFLKYLKNNFKDKSVLICAHKNFIKCLDIVIKDKDIKEFYNYETPENREIRVYEL